MILQVEAQPAATLRLVDRFAIVYMCQFHSDRHALTHCTEQDFRAGYSGKGGRRALDLVGSWVLCGIHRESRILVARLASGLLDVSQPGLCHRALVSTQARGEDAVVRLRLDVIDPQDQETISYELLHLRSAERASLCGPHRALQKPGVVVSIASQRSSRGRPN